MGAIASGVRDTGDNLAEEDETAAITQQVDAWTASLLGRLREYTEIAVAQTQVGLREAAKHQPASERGNVGVRVRQQSSPAATPGSYAIEWVSFKWHHQESGTGKRRTCYTTYIRRGKEDSYQRRDFAGLVRPWQMPLIMAAETEFAAIRRVIRQVAAVRTQLRAALRAARDLERQGTSGEGSEW